MGKIGDNSGGRTTSAFKKIAAGVDAAAKAKVAAPASKAKETRRAAVPGINGRARASEALDSPEAATAASDPAASREITRRQSSTAAVLTGTSEPSTFDRLASDQTLEEAGPVRAAHGAQDEPESEALRPVENPLTEEQRVNMEAPEAFSAETPLPTVPDFQGQTPTSSTPALGGGTIDTYVSDGVTYTRTTSPTGQTSTSFQQDGLTYSSTTQADGRSSVSLSQHTEDGRVHSRTVTTGVDGQVTDKGSVVATDRASGQQTVQSRQVVRSPDGVAPVTEEVQRPDGGVATLTRVEQPHAPGEIPRATETYQYSGEQGTVLRNTTELSDGSKESRTERNYTVNQSLEEIAQAPDQPQHVRGQAAPLPPKERDRTAVREMEVTTTDPSGNQRLEYGESTYSQSSTDLQLSTGEFSNPTFPPPITPDSDNSKITHTVTRVQQRDQNGAMVESVAGSQTLTLKGDRDPEASGGDVTATRTDTWNAAGTSNTTFQTQGLQQSELFALSTTGSDVSGGFPVQVGGNPVAISGGYPLVGNGPYDHFGRKGNGEVETWLGSEGDMDLGISVSRDAQGEVTSGSLQFSQLDANGNGKVVTRQQQAGQQATWDYTDYSNNGQNYRRQSVFEGSKISVYETHEVTGPGQFVTTTETSEDGKPIANTTARRQELSEADLRRYADEGKLTPAQMDRMLQDAPPYFVESFDETAQPLRDEDGLRRDSEGRPLETGHSVTSLTLSSQNGYSVSDHFRQVDGENGEASQSRLTTETDPDGNPPLSGRLENHQRDSANGPLRQTESGALAVSSDGQMTFDGQPVGQFETGGADLGSFLREGKSVTASEMLALAGAVGKAGSAPERLPRTPFSPGGLDGSDIEFRPVSGSAMSRLAEGSDILGLAVGVQSTFAGITEGDPRKMVEGLGNITGGLNSLAVATEALGGSSRLGSAAGRFSTLTAAGTTVGKVLGAAGGVINMGLGVWDMYKAETGWDRAAGGMLAASGALIVFGGPPGWIAGGLLAIGSIMVGEGDATDTAPFDGRLNS